MQGFRVSPLEQMVGRTPMLDVTRLVDRPGVRVLAKAEWFNPGGSVKDRPALRIVHDAIARGDLRPGGTLLDATSGNTGIAYAWLGAAKGFRVKLTLSAAASLERRRALAAYGVDVELTDPQEATDGAIRRARELIAEAPDHYYYADQYNNPSNPQAHEATTGPEVWTQTQGALTHFVAGLGTTGTLVGTGRFLKRQEAAVELVGVEPDGPLHGLEGLKHLASAIVPGIFDPAVPDRRVAIPTETAHAWCRRAARDAGLLVGVSSGAALAACAEVAAGLDEGLLATVLPDAGGKYWNERFWKTTGDS